MARRSRRPAQTCPPSAWGPAFMCPCHFSSVLHRCSVHASHWSQLVCFIRGRLVSPAAAALRGAALLVDRTAYPASVIVQHRYQHMQLVCFVRGLLASSATAGEPPRFRQLQNTRATYSHRGTRGAASLSSSGMPGSITELAGRSPSEEGWVGGGGRSAGDALLVDARLQAAATERHQHCKYE